MRPWPKRRQRRRQKRRPRQRRPPPKQQLPKQRSPLLLHPKQRKLQRRRRPDPHPIQRPRSRSKQRKSNQERILKMLTPKVTRTLAIAGISAAALFSTASFAADEKLEFPQASQHALLK